MVHKCWAIKGDVDIMRDIAYRTERSQYEKVRTVKYSCMYIMYNVLVLRKVEIFLDIVELIYCNKYMEVQLTILQCGISKTWVKAPEIKILFYDINEPVTDKCAKSYRTLSEYPPLFRNTSFSFFFFLKTLMKCLYRVFHDFRV